MKQKILTALIILLFIHIALSAELTEAPFLNTKNQQDITSTYKSTTSGHTDIYAVEKIQQNVEIKPGSSLNVKNTRGNIRIIRWDNDYVDISATKKSRHGKKTLQYIALKHCFRFQSLLQKFLCLDRMNLSCLLDPTSYLLCREILFF